MGIVRSIIKIDEEKCTGCGLCVPSCAEGALVIENGKAKVVGDKYCDGLGACLGECPEGALTVEERETEAYDHHAVEEMFRAQGKTPPPNPLEAHAAPAVAPAHEGCGCAGSAPMNLKPMTPCQQANMATAQQGALSHWPVQLRLVPPHADFLQNSKLLVTADCAPVATPAYHEKFLPGRVALLGCPKFDDAQSYVQKMADIFARNDIEEVVVLEMEVPCCSGLHQIVAQGRKQAGKDVPVFRVIIGRNGQVLSKQAV